MCAVPSPLASSVHPAALRPQQISSWKGKSNCGHPQSLILRKLSLFALSGCYLEKTLSQGLSLFVLTQCAQCEFVKNNQWYYLTMQLPVVVITSWGKQEAGQKSQKP